jgi:hypothetical protein
MDGVVKDVPDPNNVPPVAAEYQFRVPAVAVAPKVAVPVLQKLPGVVLVTEGVFVTVATTAVLVGVVQPLEVAST